MNHDKQLPFNFDEIKSDLNSFQEKILLLRKKTGWSTSDIAKNIGSSFFAVSRWERGDTHPTKNDIDKIDKILEILTGSKTETNISNNFASVGIRNNIDFNSENLSDLSIFGKPNSLSIIERIAPNCFFGKISAKDLLEKHAVAAKTTNYPAVEGVSAGKNTYTYDAHTYHTKVPPQGISEVIKKYLPLDKGLVLDPFCGSGMTGVAAMVSGHDVILNELSPAASFIADRFTSSISFETFISASNSICLKLKSLRKKLYTTNCRECNLDAEIIRTTWSYRVACTNCDHKFILWDNCRKYGKNVKEHKILSEFDCPACGCKIKKSRLPRFDAVPVLVAYKCCSKTIVEHPPNQEDIENIKLFESREFVADDWYPKDQLPDGANLSQPKRRGLDSIDKFYSGRNLSALSNIWREINSIQDNELAAFLAFCFTSLYQRVTNLSEFRFWGGSGNTAHFNVPYIFNESNVFISFERKAQSIADHLATTALNFSGEKIIRNGSATDLSFIPDNSIDFIFTDPPFGANINYSDMNFLWEAWLGKKTDTENEAIVNKYQNKDVEDYKKLMTQSLRECHRVLRDNHWMVVVFMISSESVWQAIRSAIIDAGFELVRVDVFDKQHGTFKHFVSENTAGADLMLQCRKSTKKIKDSSSKSLDVEISINNFVSKLDGEIPMVPFLHVDRKSEIDYRLLYSKYISTAMISEGSMPDFVVFKEIIEKHFEE